MSDEAIAQHYRALLARHGDDARSVQYTDAPTQEARFAVLAAVGDPLTSVLDVGCGLGHLRDYLRACGWTGRYLGVDIVPEFVAMAQARMADDPLSEVQAIAPDDPALPEGCDYALLSGVFNNVRPDNQPFMERLLRSMWNAAGRGIAFNAMSSHVDYRDPGLFYSRPEDVLGFCKTELRGHPVLVHDYAVRPGGFPFEYAVLLRKAPRYPARPVLA
jgi:SAM-dependent methyltransferase